jgi:hypothetical protein
VSQTLVQMLSQTTESDVVQVARWSNMPGGEVQLDEISKSDSATLLDVVYRSLCVPGGCILLVISAVCSRGCVTVQRELSKEGTSSLILAPTNICAMELVSLLLCGRATSNILAYDSITQVKQPAWSTQLGVGLLSTHESDGQPLADDLKSPQTPVWLLHGGDHFTVLFVTDRVSNLNQGFSDQIFYHWNGLKPGGPRMAKLSISCESARNVAPSVMKSTYHKPKVGEVEDVVQAHPDDRKQSTDWTTWRFEVVLGMPEEGAASDAVNVDDDETEKNRNATLFDLNLFPPSATDKWRCRACYATRFKTMCFGLNDPSSEVDVTCEHCGKSRREVGHSIWLTYDELPSAWKRVVEKRHGPRIVELLRTKWSGAAVRLALSQEGPTEELPTI